MLAEGYMYNMRTIGLEPGDIQKLVSVVSRILNTKRLVTHYGLKTTRNLRYHWLDTVHLMTILIDIIKSDSKDHFLQSDTMQFHKLDSMDVFIVRH